MKIAILMRNLGLGLLLTGASATAAMAECIAPADPGSGWDFSCREVGKLLFELGKVEDQIQVVNLPGAVGAVAFANVVSDRGDDAGVFVAASTFTATQIAQGKYPADQDAVRWLAMLATDVGVVVVDDDSSIGSLGELMNTYKSDPGSIVTGGDGGVGGWDHLRLLSVAKAAGASADNLQGIRWVQFEGGATAITQLMGRHIDVVATDLSEAAGFLQSGDVRILAVLGSERVSAFPDVPTAKEQGIDVTGFNWRGFYTGGEVSDEQYGAWVEDLKAVYDSPEWQKTTSDKGLLPVWRGAEEFTAFVDEQVLAMRDISREIGILQ